MKRILALALTLISCSSGGTSDNKGPAPIQNPTTHTVVAPAPIAYGARPGVYAPPADSPNLAGPTVVISEGSNGTVTGVGPNGENPRSCLLTTESDGVQLDCLGQRPIKLEHTQVSFGTTAPTLGLKTWAATPEACPEGGTSIAQWIDSNQNKVYDLGEEDYTVMSVCIPPVPVSAACEVTSPSADHLMIACPDKTEIREKGSIITVCMKDRMPDRYTYTWTIRDFISDVLNKKDFTYNECVW